MRAVALTVVLCILVPGCAQPGDAPGEAGQDEGARQSWSPERGAILVYEERVPYGATPVTPRTFQVPAGTAGLVAMVKSRADPCGAALDDLREGGIRFTSPSGRTQGSAVMRIECEVGATIVTTTGGDIDLPPENGTWEVAYTGWGAGVSIHVRVEALPPGVTEPTWGSNGTFVDSL